MIEFFAAFLKASLAANFLLASGFGLGVLPQGKSKVEEALREGLSAILAVGGTMVLATLFEFFYPSRWGPDFARLPFLFMTGFLVSKGIEYYGHLPYRQTHVSCAVAAALFARAKALDFVPSVGFGWGAGVGVALVLVLVAGMMERLDFTPLPKDGRIVPVFFVLLGLLALVFGGFQGLDSK